MNGFERHGLKHTSPSQVNMWSECPAAWVARYLFDKQFSFGVAPQIGTLTERVVAACLMGGSFDDEVGKAEKDFLKDNAFNTSEKDMKRISDISAMAALALEELKPYGAPEFEGGLYTKQREIALICKGDDWELPVKGFVDFYYPEHGLVVDLKTTLRAPSAMSMSHLRQGSIYKAASGNFGVKFLYVTPKKAVWHDVENHLEVLAGVKNILNRQEKMLRLLDKEQMRDVVPLVESSFYWNGSEDILKELYGSAV
jgi:hypothetical protein